MTTPTPRLRAVAWLLPLLAAGCGREASAPPHVILITLDTVRADYLSCYGATTGDTPAIDQIAAEGVVFDRAMSASGLTPSSHATILTGAFQYHHGLRVLAAEGGYRLDPDQPTLATLFQDAGYVTGAVHSAFPVSGHFGFGEGFDEFQSFTANLEESQDGSKVGWDVQRFQRRSDETTDRALRWFTETAARGDAPVFLWIHYWDPHDPVILPPKEEFDELVYDPGTGDLKSPQARTYAAEVRYQDRNMGRLFRGLADQGLLDGTVLAITADHGQGLDDGVALHGWGMHRTLYREQLHVPLILRGPGVPRGRRAPDQVRTADVAPTVLELAGLDPGALGPTLDGTSLVTRFDGAPHGDLVAYGEQINGYDFNAGMRASRPEAAFLHMVSDGAWKVIYRPHMPERSELFHIAVDPREADDVRSAHPAEYLRLMEDLAERNPWVLAPFPPLASGGAAGPDLSELGYAPADHEGRAEWHWTCPEHGDYEAAERGRHGDGCGRILVPAGTWEEAGDR